MTNLLLTILIAAVLSFIALFVVFGILSWAFTRTIWEDKTFWASDCLQNSHHTYFKITYNPIFKEYDFSLSDSYACHRDSKAKKKFLEEWERLTGNTPTKEEMLRAIREYEFYNYEK